MKRYNISAWGDGDFGLDVDEYETGEWVRFNDVSAALARAEAAERLAVWAVRRGAWIQWVPTTSTLRIVSARPTSTEPSIIFPPGDVIEGGTDAGILAALRRAIEGEK